ncbi:MAG: methyltransferase domain-containing protein [Chlorobiaceae bacterium]|nr:methyltransferase domain-containing protein [Chlorobiaceae bacterium]
MSADPITIFRKTWGTYQKVISNNLMFHKEISEAVAKRYETHSGQLRLLDLGCGDASHITNILKPGQLAEYCGCDLSPYALDDAGINLAPLGIPVTLLCRDMLAVLHEVDENHFDIVYSSYALHHLPVEAKQTFFTQCRRALSLDGCIILVDIMREEEQSRTEYLCHYNKTVRTQWQALTPDERNQVQEHIRSCDFPETPSTLETLARHAGFTRCRRLEKRTWHEAWCYEA